MTRTGDPSRHHSTLRHGGSGRSQVSIHDVAAKAGVSIATVSRVMNSPGLVAVGTAAKVQAAIAELGYSPNPFAQGLITRASAVLGIVLPDIHGEFYSELMRGADTEARRLGYHLLVSSEPRLGEDRGGGSESQGETRHGAMPFGILDGIAVMIADANNNFSLKARQSPLPTVVLDTDMAGRGVDSVVVDNAEGTRHAVEHLLERVGADRLCFVGGPEENFDTRSRAKAFRDALAAAGHGARPDQVTFGTYTSEWGERWTRDMLRNQTLRGSGVLAANDEIAVGIMQTALEAGLKVPQDLRLIGFDDTRLATMMKPALSSVRVPMAEVGAAAIRLLVQRIADMDTPVCCVHLPAKLVIRESSVG
jgi:LacI family transcriptional regulator